MVQPISSQRFLETTRGRILGLLRCETRTVEELAQALDLTDNAVRAHLSTLERDGMVRSAGVRRGPGAGKPSTVYELPPETDSRRTNHPIPLERREVGPDSIIGQVQGLPLDEQRMVGREVRKVRHRNLRSGEEMRGLRLRPYRHIDAADGDGRRHR